MKQNQTKKLSLNKQTVSVLQASEMAAVKGGALPAITRQSDSFVACGSCFGDCPTNSTACDQPFTIGTIIKY
jgi:natural product precursor